jgi:hypothetical protein
MGNPNPRPENLKPIPRMDDTTDPLAASALMARVPIHIDAVVRSLPNRSAWLRRIITEAAQRELMKDGVLSSSTSSLCHLSKDGEI